MGDIVIYNIFETENLANDSLEYIATIGQLPLVGINAKTGGSEPNKAKTERWAMPIKRADGKWCYPAIPDRILLNYPTENINEFKELFPHTQEEYNPSWLDESEGL